MSEQKTFSFTPLSVDAAETAQQHVRPNLVIEAGAGTGKTTRIVKEVVQLLLRNPSIVLERIVLMTFTEKAAGEIADRIRAAITDLSTTLDSPTPRWPGDPSKPAIITVRPDEIESAREACAKHLPEIDRLRSQTIHSFCQSLLRSYPIEAGLTPQFRIAEGYERGRLLHEIYAEWLETELSPGTSEERLDEWRLLYRHYLGLNRLEETLTRLIPVADLMRDESLTLGDPTDVDAVIRDVLAAIKALPIQDVRAINDDMQALVVAYVRSHDVPEHGTPDGWIEWFTPIETEISKMNMRKGKQAVRDLIRPIRGEGGFEKSFLVRLRRHRVAEVLRGVAVRYFDFLEKAKDERGVVDFDDLLARTARLLDDPRILEEIRGRFDYVFVDEFQDTDRIQARIVDRIARDRRAMFVPGKVTLVGDPKQSIYAFRSADPETYRDTVDAFRSGEAKHEYLATQHRSDPRLLDALNTMFGEIFPERPEDDPNVFKPVYGRLEPARGSLLPDDAPRVRFLLVPQGDDSKSLEPEAEALASWIAARRTGAPGELRRIAILMRRSTHFQLYMDALERRGVAAVMPPAGSFLDQQAVVDLTCVLRAVSHGFDLPSQISAARSPYFALTDDEIFAHRFTCSREGDDCPYTWFLAKLGSWRNYARHASVVDVIERILDETPVPVLQRVSRDGAMADVLLERVMELAARFDAEIGGSLAAFVDELAARRDQFAESEPSVNDEGADAVRIMTIHGSKGLEFDTVVLADLAFSSRSDDLSVFATNEPRHLVFSGNLESISAWAYRSANGDELRRVQSDRERAEEQRLFYVAATRAKAELVFVTTEDLKSGAGFMKNFHTTFGKDAFIRQLSGEGTPQMRTLPVASGEGSIDAWFERVEADDSSREATPLVDSRAAAIVAKAPRIVPLAGLVVEDESVPVVLERAEAARRTAGSANRLAGILLHRVLEVWDGDAASLDGLLGLLADEEGAEAAETDIVRRRLQQLRTSETLNRVLRMDTVGRELTIHYIEDGRAREGRIDRLLRDGEQLVVLDYKSGRADVDRVARDREQVERYCELLRTAEASDATGLLWYIDFDTDEIVDA